MHRHTPKPNPILSISARSRHGQYGGFTKIRNPIPPKEQDSLVFRTPIRCP